MRYSEDMDFSLIEKDESVHIENYFQPIVDEFKAIGMPVEIVKVCKRGYGSLMALTFQKKSLCNS